MDVDSKNGLAEEREGKEGREKEGRREERKGEFRVQ